METIPHEAMCKRIVDETLDAIIVADRNGVILLWNAGAELIFGHRTDEALGQTLDLIIPERLRERHWEGFREAMARGTTRYGRELLAVPGVRKDGTRVSLEFSIVLLRDANDRLVAVGAILRDVTERWNEQKELKGRLAALEASLAEADR